MNATEAGAAARRAQGRPDQRGLHGALSPAMAAGPQKEIVRSRASWAGVHLVRAVFLYFNDDPSNVRNYRRYRRRRHLRHPGCYCIISGRYLFEAEPGSALLALVDRDSLRALAPTGSPASSPISATGVAIELRVRYADGRPPVGRGSRHQGERRDRHPVQRAHRAGRAVRSARRRPARPQPLSPRNHPGGGSGMSSRLKPSRWPC